MDFLLRKTALSALLVMHAALAGAAHPVPPELPLETLKMEQLPAPDANRIYLSDPVMPHLVDGRIHVIDGGQMRYLGMLSTSFASSSTLSRDRQSIFVATTYQSRLQRGTRTDVVEVYGTDDLNFKYEVEIPGKHIESLPMRALMGTSSDGRFLFVQNATPATSVSVVDLGAKKFVGEIPAPGCYGIIPWPDAPQRFSAICGDGTLKTFDLDEQGVLKDSGASQPFFDPDQDPIFTHYQLNGTRLSFVSFHGQVHEIELSGAAPVFAKPWNMIDAASARQGWRPSGYELFALDPHTGRLYVGMRSKGAEGTHKNPAEEIWVFDTKTQRRIGRAPGQMALSMALSNEEKPHLFVLSAIENRLLSFDLSGSKAPLRLLKRSETMGETPIYLEMH